MANQKPGSAKIVSAFLFENVNPRKFIVRLENLALYSNLLNRCVPESQRWDSSYCVASGKALAFT